jgi:hypothetical protein
MRHSVESPRSASEDTLATREGHNNNDDALVGFLMSITITPDTMSGGIDMAADINVAHLLCPNNAIEGAAKDLNDEVETARQTMLERNAAEIVAYRAAKENVPPPQKPPIARDYCAEHGQLIAAINAQVGENLPGALFLDTLNRSLVGSESKDEDIARFLAAAESVALELSCAVIIVHHCGIDASRPRGNTSLSGAVESQIKVERGNTCEVFATVELAKDFAEGAEIVSRLASSSAPMPMATQSRRWSCCQLRGRSKGGLSYASSRHANS